MLEKQNRKYEGVFSVDKIFPWTSYNQNYLNDTDDDLSDSTNKSKVGLIFDIVDSSYESNEINHNNENNPANFEINDEV